MTLSLRITELPVDNAFTAAINNAELDFSPFPDGMSDLTSHPSSPDGSGNSRSFHSSRSNCSKLC